MCIDFSTADQTPLTVRNLEIGWLPNLLYLHLYKASLSGEEPLGESLKTGEMDPSTV